MPCECVYMQISVRVRVLLRGISLVVSITSHHHCHILLCSVFIPMHDDNKNQLEDELVGNT